MPGFGQNGSIAWVVVGKPNSVHVQSPHCAGWRGKIDDPKDRTVQDFLVRLRFANLAAAEAAWRSAGRSERTVRCDPEGPGAATQRGQNAPESPPRDQRAQREPTLGDLHRLGIRTGPSLDWDPGVQGIESCRFLHTRCDDAGGASNASSGVVVLEHRL